MTLPAPFAYPTTVHQRRHRPARYVDYRSYKPWLRDEFTFRCVYCLERERWYPNRAAAFSVDHVIPQTRAPDRVCDYENLVYACLRCNSTKRDVLLSDPTRVPFAECLSINEDGTISPLNAEGADLIEILHLDHPAIIANRKKYLRILQIKLEYPNDSLIQAEFLDAFGYPDDLPDLSARRRGAPGSKSVPTPSHFQLRHGNQLDEVY